MFGAAGGGACCRTVWVGAGCLEPPLLPPNGKLCDIDAGPILVPTEIPPGLHLR